MSQGAASSAKVGNLTPAFASQAAARSRVPRSAIVASMPNPSMPWQCARYRPTGTAGARWRRWIGNLFNPTATGAPRSSALSTNARRNFAAPSLGPYRQGMKIIFCTPTANEETELQTSHRIALFERILQQSLKIPTSVKDPDDHDFLIECAKHDRRPALETLVRRPGRMSSRRVPLSGKASSPCRRLQYARCIGRRLCDRPAGRYNCRGPIGLLLPVAGI